MYDYIMSVGKTPQITEHLRYAYSPTSVLTEDITSIAVASETTSITNLQGSIFNITNPAYDYTIPQCARYYMGTGTATITYNFTNITALRGITVYYYTTTGGVSTGTIAFDGSSDGITWENYETANVLVNTNSTKVYQDKEIKYFRIVITLSGAAAEVGIRAVRFIMNSEKQSYLYNSIYTL